MNTEDRLSYLLCSECIAKVDRGELSPLDLDKAFKNMKKLIRELEHVHQLDKAEIVNYRRQIELLMEGNDG